MQRSIKQKQLLEGALLQSLVSGDTKPLKGELFQTDGEAEVRTPPYQIASALARYDGEDPKYFLGNRYNEIARKGRRFVQEKATSGLV
jgi:hypothetical protein